MNADWNNIQKAINNVFNYLDKIDLLSILKKSKDRELGNIMDELEKEYPYRDNYSDGLFDNINRDEFREYLINRYNNSNLISIVEHELSYIINL